MFSNLEKAKCAMLFSELESVSLRAAKIQNSLKQNPPNRKHIYCWYKQFTDTGSVEKQTRSDSHHFNITVYLDVLET